MNVPKRLLLGAVFTAVIAITSLPATAQISREAELKGKIAALLGKFVTWPPNAAPSGRKPLTIGIIGTDPFVDDAGVNHLELKAPTAVILKFPNVDAFKDCHILIVARDTDLKAALAKVKGPILVVGESPGSASSGAAMNLVYDPRKGNTIRLEINPKTAIAAGLKIDGGLLGSSLVDLVP